MFILVCFLIAICQAQSLGGIGSSIATMKKSRQEKKRDLLKQYDKLVEIEQERLQLNETAP